MAGSTISSTVRTELNRLKVRGWHRELALKLAASLDVEPNASSARELRALMNELGSRVVVQRPKSRLDELREQRERKLAENEQRTASS
jgi:hypothetical protein